MRRSRWNLQVAAGTVSLWASDRGQHPQRLGRSQLPGMQKRERERQGCGSGKLRVLGVSQFGAKQAEQGARRDRRGWGVHTWAGVGRARPSAARGQGCHCRPPVPGSEPTHRRHSPCRMARWTDEKMDEASLTSPSSLVPQRLAGCSSVSPGRSPTLRPWSCLPR